MTKINFQNLPDTTTPVNATNLNTMQTNIENAIGTDSGWQNLSLQNNWERYSSTFNNAQYRKIADRVYLRGFIKSGTEGSTIAQLPSGYRPLNTNVFSVNTNNSTTDVGQVRVGSGGVITATNFVSWLSLDGIVFFTD